ncbi:MAG TPA: HlyD family type I secretion periplasmic adaptor subunit [Gammaproteobacteria bacterium]|nr:HlyD family type I secretion periplasmic adaptor subunit [Gammaproteobacteria bacterium]
MAKSDFQKIEKRMLRQQSSGPSIILIVVASLIASLVYWSTIAELDVVTRGDGKMIAAADNQVVQASEGGVIISRLINENETVQENQVLFEIDPVDVSAEFEQTKQRLNSLQINKSRLDAEMLGAEFEPYPEFQGSNVTVIAAEKNLFLSRRKELNNKIGLFKNKIQQKEKDLLSFASSLQMELDLQEFIDREIKLISPLVQQNIAPETRLLELLKEKKRNLGSQERTTLATAAAEIALVELEQQIDSARENYKLQALDELSKVVSKIAELQTVLPKLSQRVSRTTVVAPMAGVISQIKYKTIGAYVRQGDILLKMVPGNEGITLEGRIKPEDISRINMNDAVKVRLSAYDSAKYGTISGAVAAISPDTVSSEDGSGSFFYTIEVKITSDMVLDSGELVQLKPGMTATIDVLSGKRTVFDYVWSPMAKVQELALRD